MSDDPRSYRVPVLRITDVSRDSGLNDENVQDDSFDFKAPSVAPQQATAPARLTALPSEPAVPVAAYIAPAPKEEVPVEVPGYMVPPVPVRPAPESLPVDNSPRTPLPKPVDPFEKQRAPDPLDIWEQAALKKSTPIPPPAPRPAPAPHTEPVVPPQPEPVPQAQSVEPVVAPRPVVIPEPQVQPAPAITPGLVSPPPPQVEPIVTPQPVSIPQPQTEPVPIIIPEPVLPQPHPVEPIFTPQPAPIPMPVAEKGVTPVVSTVPNTPSASPFTYGTPPVQKIEEPVVEKPIELPPEPAPEPATGAKTEDLLNQALAGMGFANLPEEKPTRTLPVSEPTPAPLPNVNVPAEKVTVKKDVPLPPRVEPVPTPPTAEDTLATPAKTPESNLTALRERVLHAGGHKEAGVEQKHIVIQAEKQTVPVPAPAPEAKELTRTFSAPPAPPPPPSTEKPAGDVVPLPPAKRGLETTHARAIADVAEALHAIQQSDMEQPAPPPPPTPEAYVPTAEGAPFVVQPAQAPPTNEGVSTPRRTGIPMMRTFKSDVEKTINRDRVSVVKMISDQEVHRHDSPDVTVRKTKRQHFTIASPILLTLTLILVVGAIALGVFISVVVLRPNVTDTVNTLFFANESVEHDTTGQDRTALLQSLTRIRDSVSLPLGQVMEIVLIEHIVLNDVDTGQTRSVTGKEFLQRVNARAPSTLVRTVLDSFIIGVHAQARQEPFIVLRAGYHENAFSGMLLWEETMDADLSPFFGAPVVREEEPLPQTTGTSSEFNPTTIDTRDLGTFDDATIANTATRVLRDAGGTIRMVWAMPDTSTIIITTNPQTFEEIKNRMQAR